MIRLPALAVVALVSWLAGPSQATPDFDAAARQARDLLAELVAADTSNPPGNEARAVEIGAKRLAAAGIPYRVSTFAPGRQNLVARVAGDGSREPLLLLAHIDVVGTQGQDWSSDPRVLTARDGYLVGRGTADDLGMAALGMIALEALQRENVPLSRDVILAWTGDEESGGAGIQWLLEHEPESIRAELALNEGGALRLGADGGVARLDLQVAEKIYQDFVLETRGTTGHSSVPLADNAIARLARAVARVDAHRFPARLLPVTRSHLAERGAVTGGAFGDAMRAVAQASLPLPEDALAILARDPSLDATLRTTCTSTLIEGGTRVNALPARASATLNCRILPDRTPEQIGERLREWIDDPEVVVRATEDFGWGEASPVEGVVPDAVRAVAQRMWPGVPIVPLLSRGATDSRFLRAAGIPTYGISPIANWESDARRAHGADERIPEASLAPGAEYLYRLLVEIAGRPSRAGTSRSRGPTPETWSLHIAR
jgi:acetylornithine deacetylase/succinyl-diaminopimelate desuccinylase-like protein